MKQSLYYTASDLKHYCTAVFRSVGVSEKEAKVASDSLIRADLEETRSHGISRLPIYIQRIKEKRIKASPDIKINKNGTALIVDGDNGLGQVVADKALNEGINETKKAGIVGVFISNSNHFGTAAYFCEKACKNNIAILATTNSPPGIAPWGGKKAYFGTNPIAFGFPTKNNGPVIIDMSSSVVARGNIILAKKEGKRIPENWALDEYGKKTTDPSEALKGSMLPTGGSKGYALAMAVELLSSILTGAAFGPHVYNLYKHGDLPANVGHSFILINIYSIMDYNVYFSRIHQLINEIKESPLMEDTEEILYPGERRYRAFIKNKKEGIPISKQEIKELLKLSKEQGVKFPNPIL